MAKELCSGRSVCMEKVVGNGTFFVAPEYERKILGRRVGRRRDFSGVLRYFETNEIIHTNWYGPQFMMFGIR